jgi:tRNA (cytosine38-C5)-methyltransferase
MSATNDREVPVQATDEESITFVEFYAGVGGWSMALSQAMQRCAPKRRLDRLAALDHSDLCLKVLEHNFSSQSTKTVSIERLTLAQVQEWNATIWCMSPPCQPHTRQHQNQQQDLLDPRSKSFLHLCDLLDQMDDSKLPRLLFIENVIGFESVSRRLLL